MVSVMVEKDTRLVVEIASSQLSAPQLGRHSHTLQSAGPAAAPSSSFQTAGPEQRPHHHSKVRVQGQRPLAGRSGAAPREQRSPELACASERGPGLVSRSETRWRSQRRMWLIAALRGDRRRRRAAQPRCRTQAQAAAYSGSILFSCAQWTHTAVYDSPRDATMKTLRQCAQATARVLLVPPAGRACWFGCPCARGEGT